MRSLLVTTLALLNFGVFAPSQFPAATVDQPAANVPAKTPEDVLADIQKILPGNWTCKLTTNPGNVVDRYNFQVEMPAPAFYLDFTNAVAAQLGGFVIGMRFPPSNPNLRLFFYADTPQFALRAWNPGWGVDVKEIGRLSGYRVVANSEWVNDGFSGGNLGLSIAPMGRALEACFGRLPDGRVRDSLGLGENSAERLKGPYGFSGRVVDDQTGQPIPQFYLNWLAGDAGMPAAEVNHATAMQMHFDGMFACDANSRWQAGTELPLKIFAPGYAPAPFSLAPIVWPVKLTNLVVRMHRGGTLRGRVLDDSRTPDIGVKQNVRFFPQSASRME